MSSSACVYAGCVTRAPKEAERVGFEPTVRNYRTPVFETGSFSRSDTSPKGLLGALPNRRRAEQDSRHDPRKPRRTRVTGLPPRQGVFR